ncbi:MAG: patatin-like phospholipase family protein [Cyclobacteriaceae bacterium]|jgi:hypothetical protein
MAQPNKKDFEIGLVLAGAVSAGAYTAGVMDFLFEALEKWDNAKEEWRRTKEEGKKVPMHNVKIKVITGASAGGMTAAMAAVEVRKRSMGQGKNDKQSSFFKAWVDMIDIKPLLSCDDLVNSKRNKDKTSKPILSLLNSSIIDKIADQIIKIEPGVWKQLPYVGNELKIYLSLSNLRGIPYKFDLEGESGFPYEMTSHADYQYVEISENTKEKDWEKLKNAAIATGAFPIGLSARIIQRSRKEYEKRLKDDGLNTSKLMELGDDENFDFVAVDGGLLNNEPLELAKSALYAHEGDVLKQEKENKEILQLLSQQKLTNEAEKEVIEKKLNDLKIAKGQSISNAIIMVDPFPNINKQTKQPEAEDVGLFNILGPVIGAMRSQCLFKPEELLLSSSDAIYDRFLIAPIRYSKDGVLEKEKPLASGFFEGFGGFLSHDFRRHDYYLGRRNCQQFLKYYFSVPINDIRNNVVFKDTIADSFIVTQPTELKQFKKNPDERYPIIPLIGGLREKDEPLMEWPTYSNDEFNAVKKLLAERILALVNKGLPLARFAKLLSVLLIIALGAIGIIHLYQYCKCDSWGEPCDTTVFHILSFGVGALEFFLMIFSTSILLFLLALHLLKVWAKTKVIALIESYLKEYKLDIK